MAKKIKCKVCKKNIRQKSGPGRPRSTHEKCKSKKTPKKKKNKKKKILKKKKSSVPYYWRKKSVTKKKKKKKASKKKPRPVKKKGCKARTRRGTCGNWALTGQDYCGTHQSRSQKPKVIHTESYKGSTITIKTSSGAKPFSGSVSKPGCHTYRTSRKTKKTLLRQLKDVAAGWAQYPRRKKKVRRRR